MKEVILPRLENVHGNGTKYRAKCPAREHSSGNSTLSILFNTDGRTLIHCHGGCEANDVLEAIGLSLTDLYPDGAIQKFMNEAAKSHAPKPKQNKYQAWLEVAERQRRKLQKGERFTPSTMQLLHEMYLKSKQA